MDEAEGQLRSQEVSSEAIAAGLARFHALYNHLKPFERKELFHLVLNRTEVGDRQIVLEIKETSQHSWLGRLQKALNALWHQSGSPGWCPRASSETFSR